MSTPTMLGLALFVCLIAGFFLIRSLRKKNQNKIVDDDEQEEEREVAQSIRPKSAKTSSQQPNVKTEERGFLTNVFVIRNGRTELVEMKLKEPLGTGMDREPAVPFKGRFMAIEKKSKDGKTTTYVSYDPREEPVISSSTPWDCFDATHCEDKVDAVYANRSEFGEKLNTVIIAIALILNFIVCLVALGKVG
ncbi:MAG TPA: hypothetical protein VMR45_02685 [Patescibacteria group bacterium]|nr:hypothetical protein [Patescibacteria group bacterium]